GIAQTAGAHGEAFVAPAIAVRTGDTPQAERARFQREPADILITTPESLYLLLTSNAREALRSIDTIIIDEIHALVPTKRGAHLGTLRYRPVTIVDAGHKKSLALTIEVPVEDMAKLTTADDIPSGPASVGDTRPSIWSAIHPRLLELIRAHRSTLIFVNSRRLAERLAGALNELAGETLVRSHHGSIARAQRVEIEDLLKAGALRALVATSSLELGID